MRLDTQDLARREPGFTTKKCAIEGRNLKEVGMPRSIGSGTSEILVVEPV